MHTTQNHVLKAGILKILADLQYHPKPARVICEEIILFVSGLAETLETKHKAKGIKFLLCLSRSTAGVKIGLDLEVDLPTKGIPRIGGYTPHASTLVFTPNLGDIILNLYDGTKVSFLHDDDHVSRDSLVTALSLPILSQVSEQLSVVVYGAG